MNRKLWEAVKEYIDAAIADKMPGADCAESLRKSELNKDVFALLNILDSHVTTSDYKQIFNQANQVNEDEFVD